MTDFKAGELLLLESGEYSDRQTVGPFRVLKDFSSEVAISECRSEWKKGKDEWRDEPDESTLIAFLSINHYIEDVESRYWHIDSYGRLTP